MKTGYITNPFGTFEVTLTEGDIIDMMRGGISVEIGPNDTMRGLLNGNPDPKGWRPIVDEAIPSLVKMKVLGETR